MIEGQALDVVPTNSSRLLEISNHSAPRKYGMPALRKRRKNNESRQLFIVCVDCEAGLSKIDWPSLLPDYHCDVFGSSAEAVTHVTTHCVDAIVATCPVAVVDIVMHLKSRRSELPVILIRGNDISELPEQTMSVMAHEVKDELHLVAYLREYLATSGKYPIEAVPYPLEDLHWPVSVLIDRNGQLVEVHGRTVTLGRQGMHCTLDDTLQIAETVLVTFDNAPEDPAIRARVRYRYRDVYGLVFEQ